LHYDRASAYQALQQPDIKCIVSAEEPLKVVQPDNDTG
jgi:hypothetical protein